MKQTQKQPTKRANVGKRAGHVATTKAKSARKASPAEKAHVARDGSKTAKVLDLLKRPGGATSKELMKATGWQSHSVRGFISGTVGKKMGLSITSAKNEAGDRVYSIESTTPSSARLA
jgi:tRNA U34 2-thiouridine synthase MnmA/TrmU